MRTRGIALVIVGMLTAALLSPVSAFAATTYSTHIVRSSACGKGGVRAYGSYALWSESDYTELESGEPSPTAGRLVLFDAVSGTATTIGESTYGFPYYDIGPGCVAYEQPPVPGVNAEVRLYDIVHRTTSCLATLGVETISPLACGDGFVAWPDGLLHVYDIASATETTPAVGGEIVQLVADGDWLAWIEPPTVPEARAKGRALNVRTGAMKSIAVPSFSPYHCSISSAGVLLEGEGPAYFTGQYLWTLGDGRATKLISSTNVLTFMTGSALSSRYAAWTYKSQPEFQGTRIAVMDLATRTWEYVTPYVRSAYVGDVVDDRLWITQTLSGDAQAIGYIDILDVQDVSPTPSSGTRTWVSVSSAVSDVVTSASETTPSVITTAAAEPEQPASGTAGVSPGGAAPPASPGTGAPAWLPAAVVAAAAGLGGFLWWMRRRAL